jgi:hypothetical protein
MRVRITITDDQGHVYEGEADVSRRGAAARVKLPAKPKPAPATTSSTAFVFSLNPRAFMKKYGRGRSGAEKFTLLLACLAKGDVAKDVTLQTIQSHWGKMTGLIGKFNPAHSIRARDNGWVDTKKVGVYVLTESWKDGVGVRDG